MCLMKIEFLEEGKNLGHVRSRTVVVENNKFIQTDFFSQKQF
jgi:hypothetical protein